MTKYLNITETGQKLVEWSEQMTDEPIIITKEGQPIMVALNYAQIESWLETLDIYKTKSLPKSYLKRFNSINRDKELLGKMLKNNSVGNY
jgi:PHD/YefM family antitoxin component YafN of YafNO toxin-antitoxin module